MKKIYLLTIASIIAHGLLAQTEEVLPRFLTDNEKAILPAYVFPHTERSIETPPQFENLRTMAEWEEIQALTITWRSFPGILKQIVRAAKEECRVIIFCENCNSAETYLLGDAAGGPLANMDNIELVQAESNSIWMRDYGANTVYGNRVDTLFLVDWIYNRPRPEDDVIPEVLSDYMGIDLYSTTAAPSDLVNTGGNFMSDGNGTAWASELILEENEPGNPYNVSVKNEDEIDQILLDFQGIARNIKMTALQYDIINHIDMHLKIINEETLLVGEYPPGTADGPQINANIDYVVNTFQSLFETDYKIVRIPMPDSPSGLFPDDNPPAYYRTYTNGVFVNKTYIYPTYREEYDTTAARIYSELLPGYTLVPIDCDNSGENIISNAGAIHCITHSVGVADPLLITHQPLGDTYSTVGTYTASAKVEHRSGISSSTLHWRLMGDEDFSELTMTQNDIDLTSFDFGIPAQSVGSIIEYYISAEAENGKTLSRPLVAPEGFWSFEVLGEVLGIDQLQNLKLSPLYPNPAHAFVSIPIYTKSPEQINVNVHDISGRKLINVYTGKLNGDRRLSLDVSTLANGIYQVVVSGKSGIQSMPLMVSH